MPLPGDAALADKVRRFRYTSPCGKRNQPARLDKKGRPYAKCAGCFRTIFWRNPEKFLSAQPFCRHAPGYRPTRAKSGSETSWCGECEIRVFQPTPKG